MIEACNYGEIAHFSNQVQTVERVRKQVGTVLNHFLFGEEAARFRAEPSSNRSNGRPRPFFDRLRWDRPPWTVGYRGRIIISPVRSLFREVSNEVFIPRTSTVSR